MQFDQIFGKCEFEKINFESLQPLSANEKLFSSDQEFNDLDDTTKKTTSKNSLNLQEDHFHSNYKLKVDHEAANKFSFGQMQPPISFQKNTVYQKTEITESLTPSNSNPFKLKMDHFNSDLIFESQNKDSKSPKSNRNLKK